MIVPLKSTTSVLQTQRRPLFCIRSNTFMNMIMEIHLSKGFSFGNGDTMFPVVPGFLLFPGGKEGKGWGSTAWKARSPLGIHCTGIQESRIKLFYSFQQPLWPMPAAPAYKSVWGRLGGWKGKVRGLKSVPLTGPGLPLQAGESLFWGTLNDGIIFIFWCIQVTHVITGWFLKLMLFFWPS